MKKVLLSRINSNNIPTTNNISSGENTTISPVVICSLENPKNTFLDEPKLVPVKREESFPLISLDQATEKIPAKRGRKTNQERMLIRQQQQQMLASPNFQTPTKTTSKLKRRTHYISDDSEEDESNSSEDDYNDPRRQTSKEESEEEEEDDEKLYCICKTKYNKNLWMIGCDECDEWFHGKCLKITALEARKIKKFICPHCSTKTGKQTTFKEAKRRKSSPQTDKVLNQKQDPMVDSPPFPALDDPQIVNTNHHHLEMLSSSSPETQQVFIHSSSIITTNNNNMKNDSKMNQGIIVTLDQ